MLKDDQDYLVSNGLKYSKNTYFNSFSAIKNPPHMLDFSGALISKLISGLISRTHTKCSISLNRYQYQCRTWDTGINAPLNVLKFTFQVKRLPVSCFKNVTEGKCCFVIFINCNIILLCIRFDPFRGAAGL